MEIPIYNIRIKQQTINLFLFVSLIEIKATFIGKHTLNMKGKTYSQMSSLENTKKKKKKWKSKI